MNGVKLSNLKILKISLFKKLAKQVHWSVMAKRLYQQMINDHLNDSATYKKLDKDRYIDYE